MWRTIEGRRPETVLGTLTRSTTLAIVDTSTLWRQFTEVGESELPNVPKIDLLVSKLALALKNDTSNHSLCMMFVQ